MTELTLKNVWHGPGYRDLRLVMIDPGTKREYEMHLAPKDVQRMIYDCADAVKQINDHPPLDWDQYPVQIHWPQITPWMPGPAPKQRTAALAE